MSHVLSSPLPVPALIVLSIIVVAATAARAASLWRKPDYRRIHRMEHENGLPLSAPVRRSRRRR